MMPLCIQMEYKQIWVATRILADGATITAVSEGVRAYALDPNTAEKLWEKSEEMVGESFQPKV